jgi:hypothetical protein
MSRSDKYRLKGGLRRLAGLRGVRPRRRGARLAPNKRNPEFAKPVPKPVFLGVTATRNHPYGADDSGSRW